MAVKMQEEVVHRQVEAMQAAVVETQAETVEAAVHLNSNVLMAVNVLLCHGTAMALQKMEMLLGDLIALMAAMKTWQLVVQQESMRKLIAQDQKPAVNLLRASVQMDSV